MGIHLDSQGILSLRNFLPLSDVNPLDDRSAAGEQRVDERWPFNPAAIRMQSVALANSFDCLCVSPSNPR